MFYFADSAEVNDLVVTDGVIAALAQNTSFDSDTVKGTLTMENNEGAFVGYAYTKLDFNNCRNEANITSSSYSAVFVGYAAGSVELNFKNCWNAGQYVGLKSSLFVGNVPTSSSVLDLNVTNCGNIDGGSVRATSTASNYKWNCYVSTYAGTVNLTLNGTATGLSTIISGNFYQGPNDTMKLTVNEDKTFTITKSDISNVSYYIVRISKYARNTDGVSTNLFNVEEKIEAFTTDTKVTTIKYLSFTNTKLTSDSTLCDWTVTSDGTDSYYYFDKEDYSITDKSEPNFVTCLAYDSDGNLLSSVTL